jgi:aminotransferase
LPDGLPELREAVAHVHLQATGIAVDPDRNVLITCGNMQGLNALLHVLVDPGDEVIVTDPGFASHFQQIRLCGGKPVHWQLDEAGGWRLDVEALPDLVTARTRALILVSPSNPTGKIFTENELRRVGEIAAAHDLLLLLDDPYSHFAYENRQHLFNLASVPELADRTAYLFTFSKAYAMSGWRIGYMIIAEALKRELLKVHDATVICAPRISQVAALAALRTAPAHLAEFEAALRRRRTLICARLDRLPQVFRYHQPEGAYYVFPRIVAPHLDARQFALRLLAEAKVTVTPGSAFGPSGEHHLRLAYCVSEPTITTAFDRLEAHFAT